MDKLLELFGLEVPHDFGGKLCDSGHADRLLARVGEQYFVSTQ
jgi:hypothetical protein